MASNKDVHVHLKNKRKADDKNESDSDIFRASKHMEKAMVRLEVIPGIFQSKSSYKTDL